MSKNTALEEGIGIPQKGMKPGEHDPESQFCSTEHRIMANHPLPSPIELKKLLPASSHHRAFVNNIREQIIDILEGRDCRLLLVIGPCSIHDKESALEYAFRLKELAQAVEPSFLLVMRTYFEKPRTSIGWKGILYDPLLDNTHDIHAGLITARELLLTLAEMKVPAGTEFLDPTAPAYLGDLISWSCIGARTAESQIHRQFASGLPMPVAFKNNTLGNINVAIHGALAASHPHAYFGINDEGQISIVRTQGNRHAHVVLRGGEGGSNYDERSIADALKLLKLHHLQERIVIDCSHDNSLRQHEKQKDVFNSVLEQRIKGNLAIRGLALESHLESGSQQFPGEIALLQYGVSVTDPCMDWKSSEALVKEGAALLKLTVNS